MMMYMKWAVIGNGVVTLLVYLIGTATRYGWLGDNKFTELLRWFNDVSVMVMKSSKGGSLI